MGVSPGGSGLTPTSPSEAKKCSGCEKPRPGAVKGPWILSLDPLERLCWGNGNSVAWVGMGNTSRTMERHSKEQMDRAGMMEGGTGWALSSFQPALAFHHPAIP